MKSFFESFTDSDYSLVDRDKMLTILKLIQKRGENCKFCFLSIVRCLADHMEECKDFMDENHQQLRERIPEVIEELVNKNMETAIYISLMAKFLYPLTEQIDTLTNHGLQCIEKKKG